MNKVIHVSDMPNYLDAVYVGRANARANLPASPFANPFKIGREGNRQEVIAKFDQHLQDLIFSGEFDIERFIALRDKPLACWCRKDGVAMTVDNECHADLINVYFEIYTDGDLRALATRVTP